MGLQELEILPLAAREIRGEGSGGPLRGKTGRAQRLTLLSCARPEREFLATVHRGRVRRDPTRRGPGPVRGSTFLAVDLSPTLVNLWEAALRELPPDVTGCEDVLPAQVAASVRELVARHGLPPLRTRP